MLSSILPVFLFVCCNFTITHSWTSRMFSYRQMNSSRFSMTTVRPPKIEFPSRLAPFHWRRWDFKQIKYQKRFNSIEFHVSYSKDILRWNLSALDVRHRLISRFLYFVSSKRSFFFFRVWKLFFYANAMNRNPIGHFEKNFLQILRDWDGFSSSFFCPSLPSTSSEEKAACGWWKNLSCI